MKWKIRTLFLVIIITFLSACTKNKEITESSSLPITPTPLIETSNLKVGNDTYRGFILDNVLKSSYGDIHFNSYFPQINDNEKIDLFVSLPGYNGLYFQGVGANLKTENFVFEALNYNDKMMIVALQLNDWGKTSANQTIALVTYLKENYNIENIYIDGYSGGGETLSLVMSLRPELFKRALHVASVWDGTISELVNSRVPIYFVIGKNDEYYGSSRISNTYNQIVFEYKKLNLTDDEISKLATLDIKDATYFNGTNQHGGIGKVSHDDKIMSWLFK